MTKREKRYHARKIKVLGAGKGTQHYISIDMAYKKDKTAVHNWVKKANVFEYIAQLLQNE